MALNIAEVGAFLEASTCFVLAVTEIHGVRVEDLERRRTLITAILLGDSGAGFVQKAAGRTAPHWGRMIVKGIPMSAINAANRELGPRFIVKFRTTQGILVLGRQVPFWLGMAIGAGGNAAFRHATVLASRRAFGPAPDAFFDLREQPTSVRDDG